MSKEENTLKRTVDSDDKNLIVKTDLGCGVDITGVIGKGESVKTQIVDYDALLEKGLVEIDDQERRYDIIRSGKDYSSMTKAINACLAGSIKLGVAGLSFSKNLSNRFNKTTTQTDIFEYSEKMTLRTMFALNIKPVALENLRAFMPVSSWHEINATYGSRDERENKESIKALYRKYGTHISTKCSYGCMYEYIMRREQNDWETSLEKLLKMDIQSKFPVPGTGANIGIDTNLSFDSKDTECRNNGNIETYENRIGGDTSKSDFDEWIASCHKGADDNCAFLGFSLADNGAEDSGLVPLYELIDESDYRREAMIAALEEYMAENGFTVEQRKMVIVDAIAKRFDNGNAPEYYYDDDCCGVRRKFFRLDENVYDHVKGSTHGKMYFYYALGHLTANAVAEMKFCSKGDANGDWKIRGVNSNDGVVGCLTDRYLAIKIHHIGNYPDASGYVSGFGLKVDKNMKAVSKGTETGNGFTWIENPDSEDWYSAGLIHDDVKCMYTYNKLNQF